VKVRVSNKVFALALAALVLLMFSFAYANVPLFKMFCERFGLDNSGKARITGGAAPVSSATANFKARNVRVKFMGVAGTGLPVRFGPSEPTVSTYPGKPVKVDYTFENESGDSVFFRAVHSIRPMEAAKEFQLIQCFCFEDQTLGPHERRVLPVYFALSPRFPSNVNELILNYSLFPRDPSQPMPVPATAAN
jgi:cytochrome c oxidase assembly protein subunit 11